ncbi:MAG TPA: hypothetical protein VFC71_03590, partial [Candidatus Polarisedimenticolia bacterium]|nr:hypothetical protein [Candidatus Polarisedimenticolia bacterium]
SWLLSESAFRLADIDPTRLLVVKIRPNIGETNAPPGPYMFLERGAGSFALLCPYMAPVGAKPSVDCD